MVLRLRNYKSNDKIFFGPLESISLLNGGKNYDVTCILQIYNYQDLVQIIQTALIRPIVTGDIVDVQVDPQDFDIKKIISVTIEGGNGSGTVSRTCSSKKEKRTII